MIEGPLELERNDEIFHVNAHKTSSDPETASLPTPADEEKMQAAYIQRQPAAIRVDGAWLEMADLGGIVPTDCDAPGTASPPGWSATTSIYRYDDAARAAVRIPALTFGRPLRERKPSPS